MPEKREIPLRRKKKENGKTEFSLLWKTNRFSPSSTKKPLFHKENAVEKKDGRKKSKQFFQNGFSLPALSGRGEGFPKGFPFVFHRFSQG